MTQRASTYVISAALALTFWVGSATAQEPEATPVAEAVEDEPEAADPKRAKALALEKKLEEEERTVIAHYDETVAKTREAMARMEAATGDERRVLENQVVELKLEILSTFDAGIDIMNKQGRAGLDTTRLRKILEDELLRITPSIVRHIEVSELRLDELRKTRDALPLDEALPIEQQIGREAEWTGKLYRAYRDVVRWRAALALDSGAPLADLQARLITQADFETGRIQVVEERLFELREHAGDAPGEADKKAAAALTERKQNLIEHLTALSNIMGNVDMDASKYQALIFDSTGDFTFAMIKPGFIAEQARRFVDSARSYLQANGLNLLLKIALFVLIVVAARLLGTIAKRLMRQALEASHARRSQLLQNMIVSVTGDSVLAIGVLIGLDQLGVAIGPLLAGLGIAGFIVGFALQDSLANFAAGMLILGYRPYDEGDMIDGGGVFGQVSDMNLVSTTILTIDNQTLIVPNGKIWGNVIKNVTNQAVRRVDMKFSVGYASELDHVEGVLMEILRRHELVLDDPEPMVRLHELQDDGMLFVVRPWVKTADYWSVYWDVTREVKCAFDREGIEIPFPQRQLHMERDVRVVGDHASA